MTREETLASLKTLVRFFERNPEIPMPYIDNNLYAHHYDSKSDLLETIRKLKIVLFHPLEKMQSDYFGGVFVMLGKIRVSWVCNREAVCTPKKIEIVQVPASEAYTYKKVIEWECLPLSEESTEARE